QVRGNADKEEDGSGKESEVVKGNPDKPEKQNIETIQVVDGDGSDGGQKESANTVDLTREDGENVVALEGQQDKNFFEFMKGEEQQFLEGGLEHIPVMPMDLGNEFSVETAGAFGEEKMTKSGLVTLAQFAEIERENKEDWVLDNRIAELLRPSLSLADMANYVSGEAIRIALMGPMGCARWAALACQEIVNRNDELYLLVDKKIERYKHVVTELQLLTDEAIQSVERLNLLRQELNNKIEEAHKEQKKFADTKEWAAQQKNARTSAAGTLAGGGGRLARLGSATIGLTVNETPRCQRDFQCKESVEVSPNFSFKHEIKPEKTVIKREKTVDADALIKAQEEGRRDIRDRRGSRGFLKTRNWSPDKESMSGGDEEEDYVDDYEYGRSRRDSYAQGPKRGRREPKRGREEYRDGRQGSGYYRSERWEGRAGYDDDNSDWYSPESGDYHNLDRRSHYSSSRKDSDRHHTDHLVRYRHWSDYGSPRRGDQREGDHDRGRCRENEEGRDRAKEKEDRLRARSGSLMPQREWQGGRNKELRHDRDRSESNSQIVASENPRTANILTIPGGDKGKVNSTTSPVMEDQGEIDQGEVGASTVTIPGGDKEQVNSTKSPVMEDKGVGWACCGGRKMLSMNEEVDNDDDLMPE
ncbi:hypothetical protein L211DRAFT_853292, partial [Terfezia boudieri ATCC MYA-4762]